MSIWFCSFVRWMKSNLLSFAFGRASSLQHVRNILVLYRAIDFHNRQADFCTKHIRWSLTLSCFSISSKLLEIGDGDMKKSLLHISQFQTCGADGSQVYSLFVAPLFCLWTTKLYSFTQAINYLIQNLVFHRKNKTRNIYYWELYQRNEQKQLLDFQGILAMLSAILGQQFFMECYYPLGEVVSKVW